jgi:hypothetical protein
MLGKEFNNIYKDQLFYKILNRDCLDYYGITYDNGLNIFNGSLSYIDNIINKENNENKYNEIESNDGIVFFKKEDIYLMCNNYDAHYIVSISLPDDAIINIYDNGLYLTDKIIINMQNGGLIEDFEYWENGDFCKRQVQENGNTLRFVKYKNKYICKLALEENSNAFQFVDDNLKDNNICEYAVKRNGLNLQFVPYNMRTEEICKYAVKNNSDAIHFVPYNHKDMFYGKKRKYGFFN